MTSHDDKRPISDVHARFLDDLSAAVDGDADALRAAADLLAESDEARDLLFDAKRVASRVGDAGGDFVPQPGLEARVLAALDARGGAQVAPAAAPVPVAVASVPAQPAPVAAAPVSTQVGTPDPLDSPWAGGRKDKADAFGSAVDTVPEKKRPSAVADTNERAPEAAPRAGVRRSGLALVVGGGALFAIAAVATLAYVGGNLFGGDPEAPVVAAQGWSAEVVTVVRAADESTESGVSVRMAGATAFLPAAQGVTVTAGATLRTDARTRALLRLSDGTQLTVNRDSEVTLETTGPRNLRLERGELLAEVAHLSAGPQRQPLHAARAHRGAGHEVPAHHRRGHGQRAGAARRGACARRRWLGGSEGRPRGHPAPERGRHRDPRDAPRLAGGLERAGRRGRRRRHAGAGHR
jgi:hypothetical protein